MENKRRDLRVLWNSNAVWTNSGYAAEQRDLLFRMRKDGWETAQVGFWGLMGYPVTVYGQDLIDARFKDISLKVYPRLDQDYGTDAMLYHGQDYKANVLMTMQDVPLLDPNILSQLKVPFIPWVPIDKTPVPPAVLNILRYAYKIVTFSRFGQQELEKHGFTSTLIIEGTDTNIFKPEDKIEARKKLGLPQDRFLFGMVAANKENPPRKGFEEALQAFKLFHDKHPEAALMIHSQQQAPGGFPIQPFVQHLKLNDSVFFMDNYHAIFMSDSHTINTEMNAFDVLLHPSQTEGFGLTVIEAQAAGTPAIVNNCHSMPELVIPGKTGEICAVESKRFTSDLSYVYRADITSLYEQMEKVYAMVKADPYKVQVDCREHVKKHFNIDTIYQEQWVPFYESLQAELLPLQK